MEKPNVNDLEFMFYETQLKQNTYLKMTESQIKATVDKIIKKEHNEGIFFQFAFNPSSKEKSVLAKKDIKAYEESFIINHVSTFSIKESRKDLERSDKMMEIFETIVGDQNIDDFDCLVNQKPKLSSFENFEKLRNSLKEGNKFKIKN